MRMRVEEGSDEAPKGNGLRAGKVLLEIRPPVEAAASSVIVLTVNRRIIRMHMMRNLQMAQLMDLVIKVVSMRTTSTPILFLTQLTSF